MQFLISGSHGTDDPTMATLPFMAAKVAREQGHDVVLFLWNKAVMLARPGISDHVTGVNLPPLKEVLAAIQAAAGLRCLRRGEKGRRSQSYIRGGNQGHEGLYQRCGGAGKMRRFLMRTR